MNKGFDLALCASSTPLSPGSELTMIDYTQKHNICPCTAMILNSTAIPQKIGTLLLYPQEYQRDLTNENGTSLHLLPLLPHCQLLKFEAQPARALI